MISFFWEFVQVLLRCLHIITGIAWIGASFYFVWLDNHLRKPTDPELKNKGVDGELWAVHGGGFYNPQKYMVAPPSLPHELHWFYWESYSTWMSGFALFIVTYLMNPRALLIDPTVHEMSSSSAVILALFVLGISWVFYHLLCKFLREKENLLMTLVGIMVVGIAYFCHQFFSGRAAYLLTGASMATIMTANVFFVIIPGQRKVIELMRKGEPVDPIFGKNGKQRSVHNTYFTLPVLFTMLSNHFSMMTSHPQRFLVLILMMLAAVAIRQVFVLRHKGKMSWGLVAFSVVLVGAVFGIVAPASSSSVLETSSKVSVYEVIEKRCVQCHSTHPTMVEVAPKNLILEQKDIIDQNCANIYTQVVLNRAMPLGNITQMTEEERLAVKSWFETSP